MIDTIKLERELTRFFAGVLEMTVDKTIFRGAIPETVKNGVAVRITGIVAQNAIDHPTYNVQVLGKFATRDDAWVMLTKLARAVPVYGAQTASFVLVCVLPADSGSSPFAARDKGKLVQCASFNLRICVLTLEA